MSEKKAWMDSTPSGTVQTAKSQRWLDVWKRVRVAAALHRRTVHVLSLESHVDWPELCIGLCTPFAMAAIAAADSMAGWVAAKACPPRDSVKEFLARKKLALAVQERIGTAVALASAAGT